MFDYSKSTVQPWPSTLPAPFGTDYTELTDVRWTAEDCELFIMHRPRPVDVGRHWKFRAVEPLRVLVQPEEGHLTSLWSRRDRDCPGAGGFVEVMNSPIVNAIIATDPVGEAWARRVSHFVLGTSQGVAHVLCDKPILLTEIVS